MLPPDDSAHLPNPSTAPWRLALSSWMHGGPSPKWRPADAESGARGTFGPVHVLELGSGAGENLLPLAFYDREGQYLGLELDKEHVERARDTAASLGLTNVRFEQLQGLPEDAAGQFDYVIVRDLFARVPDGLCDHLLALCERALSAEGLLYVDYPVFPGAGQQALVRELLLGVAGNEGAPDARLGRARAGGAALKELLGKPEHPYPNLLSAELDEALRLPPAEVWSRYLAPSPRAFFHREVAERAAIHGFRFVCDAGWNQPAAYVPPALRAELVSLGLRDTALEQALDIFSYRRARASVFCKADVPPAEAPGPAALDHLLVASPLSPVNEAPSLDPGVEEAFADASGRRIGSVDPLLKAALLVLRDVWPRGLSFAELMGASVAMLHQRGAAGEPNDEQLAGVARDLWTLHGRGLMDFHLAAPHLPKAPTKALHTLAQHEANQRATLTTPMHTLLPLQGFDAALVKRMTPGMPEDALVTALIACILSGEVPLELGGVRLTDPLLLEPIARGLLGRSLATLGRWGLLQGDDDGRSAAVDPAG